MSEELSNERLSAIMEDLQVIHRYAVLSLFVLEKCKVVTLKYLLFETWNVAKVVKFTNRNAQCQNMGLLRRFSQVTS